jgi:uncharacterized membrane protein
MQGWLTCHWLALANLGAATFAGLPLLAPALLAVGWPGPALLIYALYSTTCHQWPARSYFLFGSPGVYPGDGVSLAGLETAHAFLGTAATGFKMAYCERNFAIYTAVLLAGLVFVACRGWARPLRWAGLAICLAPLALDGGLQLAGVHESTWALRSLTGALAGWAGVWAVYPRLESVLRPRLDPATPSPPRDPEWLTARTRPV